jgi:hypothetical protein
MPLKNSWPFPFIESIHLVGMAAFVGTVVLKRWTNTGLAILLLTGLILFSADPTRYLHNPAFRVKMVVFPLALISHYAVRRSRIRLALSLILWTCVVLAARAIADFDT